MKRKIITISMCIALAILPVNVYANETETETEQTETELSTITFRGYDWGVLKSEIIENEITDDMKSGTDYLIEESDIIIVKDQSVAGLDAVVYYTFDDNDALDSAAYIITEEHTNKTDFYDDYTDLVRKYTNKYGEPSVSRQNWKDDLYKDDQSKWGLAVSVGDVTFVTNWEYDDGTSVGITLTGDNYDITLGVLYRAGDYEYIENTDGI